MKNLFQGKRVLCFIDRPLQIIGAISLFSIGSNQQFTCCDVYLDPSLPDAKGICERLRRENLFTSVNNGKEKIRTNYRHLGTEWLLSRRFRHRMRSNIESSFPSIVGRTYDVLVCSSPNVQNHVFKRYFVSEGYTVFFDDGAGSHNGNLFKPFFFQDDILSDSYDANGIMGRVKASAKHFLGKIPFTDNRYHPKAIWLISPTLSDYAVYKNIDILYLPVDNNRGIYERVLAPTYDPSELDGIKIIFLTTSQSVQPQVRDEEANLAASLYRQFGKRMGVRLHPNRSPEDFHQCSEAILSNSSSWELLVLSGIIPEDVILVGIGSTAQVSPKSMRDLEPYVVFIFELIKSLPKETKLVLRKTVDGLHQSYRDKQRVMAPSVNLEDLNQGADAAARELLRCISDAQKQIENHSCGVKK